MSLIKMFVNKIAIGIWLSYQSNYASLAYTILYNIIMYYDFPAPFPLNSSRLVDENVVRQTMENIRDTVNKVQVSLVESMTKQNYYMMRPWRKTGRNSSEKKWLPEFVTSMDIIVSSIHVEDLTECPFRLSPCGLGRVIKIYCKNYCEASRGRGYTITQQPPRKVYPAPCKTKQRCMYILLNKRCYMGVKQCVNSMAPM
ncbi:uncharacterized protein LOC107883125 [Acyrthosiphon pisum]|uniref:Uncharacterized protein n=1 Tax=Acyrthosiphon pisum TaxID=7029 RepID=A0A8R2JU12_ACYPI|nr:uncharacterized protein LOC107883125 [Acyrthosiphon pisum]